MVFGNVDVERLQLNEDTIWAGGPYDQSNTRGAGALAQIRQAVFANQWSQAQSLIDQNLRGIPAALQQFVAGRQLREDWRQRSAFGWLRINPPSYHPQRSGCWPG
jgi:alpha-L-fucosidase 2